MEVVRGEVKGDGYGYGYGDGCGYGYGSGDGCGSGYGDGDGYGDGYGYGDGCGSGFGDGYGYGYGYGSGFGDGCGFGSGSGSGSGYGDGCGFGFGDGSGSETYWQAAIAVFAQKWPKNQQQRLRLLQETEKVVIAFWLSDERGQACNGGRNEPVQPGTIEELPGPLQICTSRALHATFLPPKWKGSRWWIVALHGEVQREDDKVAGLKREILGECL